VNQLLGLYKWGRGKVPAIKDWDPEEEGGASDEGAAPDLSPQKIIAVIPGAFKPPHRGHLDMVKHYSTLADEVIVMVSVLPRKTPSGRDITIDDSLKMWNLYIKAANLTNVTVKVSENASPVRAAYEFVEKDAQFGDQVMLGTSTKGGDQSRFARSVQDYAKEGVSVLDPMEYAFDPVGEELSASNFRAALDTGGDIAKWIPDGVSEDEVFALFGGPKKTPMVAESIFDIINDALNEKEEIQRKWQAKHAKNRLTTKGGVKKAPPFEENPPHERSESAPPLGEQENPEELDEESGVAGVEGAAGGFIGLEDEKDRDDLTIRRTKPKKPSLIREKDKFIEEILDYLLTKQA
jgi:cytidyltransferase-like protein